MAKIGKEEIQREIEYYERQLITDPAGRSLYETMLELARKKLKEVSKDE